MENKKMIYSDINIWQALRNGSVEIQPFNEAQLGTNSYDVRLGNDFYEVFWDDEGPFFVGPYHVEDGEKVYVPAGGTLLGMTKEKIVTKNKTGAELRSRSTTRRIGITTNCDAGLGDIGYSDYWTLEFTAFVSNSLLIELLTRLNHSFEPDFLSRIVKKYHDFRPYLIVGERIAQMVFFECKSEPTRQYDGQYQAN